MLLLNQAMQYERQRERWLEHKIGTLWKVTGDKQTNQGFSERKHFCHV